MQTQNVLLTTKLHIPRTYQAGVARPRLLTRLNNVLTRKLALVSAPPGFGKTTLLVQWIDALAADTGHRSRVAWLALDEHDNDPVRFFAYLVAALHTADPSMGQTAQSLLAAVPSPELQTLLISVINDLAAQAEAWVLVLEDYHIIRSLAIHEALCYLVDHMPGNLHVVISSRADPLLPLARWRARGQLLEVREADLRFTVDETRQFLVEIMGLALSQADIELLERRTEGWIASLQLAALSMQGRTDANERLQAFGGSHAFVVDYLTEEVLDRQPSEMQEFLLQTSVLARLCAPLCRAVTGREDSQARLEQLDRSHLFVIPLDDERTWYRYHHLFAEMLRNRLSYQQPQMVNELHRRASAWFAANLLHTEAVEHALAADAEEAASLVEQVAPLFQSRGEYVTLRHWLAQLPEALLLRRPQLCLLYAKTHLFHHQLQEAEIWLDRAEAAAAALPADDVADVLSAVLIARTDSALNRDDLSTTIRLAHQVLASLPPEATRQRGEALLFLGVAHYWQGHFDEAGAAWLEASQLGLQDGNTLVAIYSLANYGRVLFDKGQLQAASAIFQQAMQMAVAGGYAQMPVMASCNTCVGLLDYERNDLESAARHLAAGIDLAQRGQNPRSLLSSYARIIPLALAQGRPAAAQQIRDQALALLQRFSISRYIVDEFRVAEVGLALYTGDVDGAARLVAAHAPGPGANVCGREAWLLAAAQVAAAQGNLSCSQELAKQAATVAHRRQFVRLEVKALAFLATLQARTGSAVCAQATLQRAMAMVEQGGYVRSLVDEGEPMRQLLLSRPPSAGGLRPETVSRLLAAFPVAEPLTDKAGRAMVMVASTDEQPIESLSEREMEVLRLADEGLTDRQIAERLIVVTGTVKRHLSNVYGKLGVHSRTQALARARQLGWL